MASPVYERIRQILESARLNVARSVNTTQVAANWLIGREIVEEEQKGKEHAGYGEELIAKLARQLGADGIPGYSAQNLRYLRQFYLVYPELLSPGICHAVRGKSEIGHASGERIHHAVRGESDRENAHALRADLHAGTIGYAVRSQSGIVSRNMARPIRHAARDEFGEARENSEAARRNSERIPAQGKQPNQHALRVDSPVAVTPSEIGHAPRDQSGIPGHLHPSLLGTHYHTLLRMDKSETRAFCGFD
jgi:hypothetical protein